MYAGEVVEVGDIERVFRALQHPYTKALLETLPHHGRSEGKLPIIDGLVPPPSAWPNGCCFHPRCTYATAVCSQEGQIPLIQVSDNQNGQFSRCIRHDEINI